MRGERWVGRFTWILCYSREPGVRCHLQKAFTQGFVVRHALHRFRVEPILYPCSPSPGVGGSWDPPPQFRTADGHQSGWQQPLAAGLLLVLIVAWPSYLYKGEQLIRGKKWEGIFPLIHSVTAALHLLQCGSCHQNSNPDPNLHFPQISECFKLESITFFFFLPSRNLINVLYKKWVWPTSGGR